jgi:hypothetical protein
MSGEQIPYCKGFMNPATTTMMIDHGILRRTIVHSRSRSLVALAIFVCLIFAPRTLAQSKPSSINQVPAKTSILLVDTDDSCRLMIDDEDKGVIMADHSQKFTVPFGEHLLKCKIEAVPDLFWRKAVEVKDTSQVVVVVALKALHLQYDQALTKAKSQKEEELLASTKQLAEAEAAEKQRESAKAAIPAQVLDMLRGTWNANDYRQYLSLQFGDGFDNVTLTGVYHTPAALLSPSVQPRKSTYVYKVALIVDAQNSSTLRGTVTCNTQSGPKTKEAESHKLIQCDSIKPVPITIVIQNQSELLMDLGTKRYDFRR